MSHAFRALGVYQGHSHAFEMKSGQHEEGAGPGKLLGRGGSWESNRFGLEDGTAHGTSPKCKSGGAGDISRTAAGDFALPGMLVSSIFMWLASQSSEHDFLDHRKYLASPHMSLYAVSSCGFFLLHLKIYPIYNVSLFIL